MQIRDMQIADANILACENDYECNKLMEKVLQTQIRVNFQIA